MSELNPARVDVLALGAVAKREGYDLPSDVAEYIVARLPNATPHELEGALIRVIAWASLTNTLIDLSLAFTVLNHVDEVH